VDRRSRHNGRREDFRPFFVPFTSDESWLFAQGLLDRPVCVFHDAEANRELLEWVRDTSNTFEGAWDPAKHPRGGNPKNSGEFSLAAYSGSGQARSGSAQDEATTKAASGKDTASPVTKAQLPADHRGTWVKGSKGNGVFRYDNSAENRRVGLAGKDVRFKDQHIAIGGFPPEMYYGGSAAQASVMIDKVTGFEADNKAADAAMRKKLGNPKWKHPGGYDWNHAGPPGSKTTELVKTTVHRSASHKGPAAVPRAQRRIAKTLGTPANRASTRGSSSEGATGRAMGALSVYLTARDALQAMGKLEPSYEVTERALYHFAAVDGSVFYIQEGHWYSNPKRVFVAGPRKGKTETITSAQEDEYRRTAERKFGKYIPGSLFSQPRFIPGKQRKRLPVYDEWHGLRREIGWVDEKGVHHDPEPKPIIL
jgi:hypothetical protein